MVTDKQVRMLMKLRKTEKTLCFSASKAGMDEKTARQYIHKPNIYGIFTVGPS